MSLHAIVDNRAIDQVATNQGWYDFCEWVDEQEGTEIAHLVEHGYATDMQLLADEIAAALKKSPPTEDVEDVARGVEAIARDHLDAEILVISDGTGDPDDVEGFA